MATEIKNGMFMDRDGPRRFRVDITTESAGVVEYVNDLSEVEGIAHSFGMDWANACVLVETVGQAKLRETNEAVRCGLLKQLRAIPSSDSHRGTLIKMSDEALEHEIATGSGKYKAQWITAMQHELDIRKLTGDL